MGDPLFAYGLLGVGAASSFTLLASYLSALYKVPSRGAPAAREGLTSVCLLEQVAICRLGLAAVMIAGMMLPWLGVAPSPIPFLRQVGTSGPGALLLVLLLGAYAYVTLTSLLVLLTMPVRRARLSRAENGGGDSV